MLRKLFHTAFLNRQHRFLIAFTLVAMVFLTFASQLEIVALGIITKKGPDFFELFAPIHNGQLQKSQEVDWNHLQLRWTELETKPGQVTRADTVRFLSKYRGIDLVEKVAHVIDDWLPIERSLT